MDILSGSYSGDNAEPMAGHFQVLWGKKDGSFKKVETLMGADGKALEISIPDGAEEGDVDLWRICTRPTAVDWDGDGKLDLVVGNFLGSFVWFKGAGSGKFASTSQVILSNGKPLLLNDSQHSDPVVVDWDADGDLDILSGTGSGGVQWSENTAGKGKPAMMKPFKDLIKNSNHDEVEYPSLADGKINRGRSSRIWVSDVNGDGKLDVTVGDSLDQLVPNPRLTKAKAEEKYKTWQKKMIALNHKNEKGDMDEEAYFEDYEKLMKELERFASFTASGHVWLYLQK